VRCSARGSTPSSRTTRAAPGSPSPSSEPAAAAPSSFRVTPLSIHRSVVVGRARSSSSQSSRLSSSSAARENIGLPRQSFSSADAREKELDMYVHIINYSPGRRATARRKNGRSRRARPSRSSHAAATTRVVSYSRRDDDAPLRAGRARAAGGGAGWWVSAVPRQPEQRAAESARLGLGGQDRRAARRGRARARRLARRARARRGGMPNGGWRGA
jgi:hypothetical protein